MTRRLAPAVRAFVGAALLVLAVAVLLQQFSVAVVPAAMVVGLAVVAGAAAAAGADAVARRDAP